MLFFPFLERVMSKRVLHLHNDTSLIIAIQATSNLVWSDCSVPAASTEVYNENPCIVRIEFRDKLMSVTQVQYYFLKQD